MTLPASGAISLFDIRDEFETTNPVSLRSFLGENDVPASDPISIQDFYGVTAIKDPEFNAAAYDVTNLEAGSSGQSLTSRVGIRVNNDGTIDRLNSDGTTTTYTQVGNYENLGETDRANIEIRLDRTGSTSMFSSDAIDTWLALGSSREWSIQTASSSSTTLTEDFTLRIRVSGDTSDKDTATSTFTASITII